MTRRTGHVLAAVLTVLVALVCAAPVTARATTNNATTMMDFLQFMKEKNPSDEGVQVAIDALNGTLSTANYKDSSRPALNSYTHIGSKDDATYLTNVLDALDVIDTANEIRADHGLSALKVSTIGMVAEQMAVNWMTGTNTLAHTALIGYYCIWNSAENAASGLGKYPTDGWFYAEFANYLATNGTSGLSSYGTYVAGKDYTYENGVYRVTSPYTGMTYTGVVGGETGHFKTIMTPYMRLVGMGYNGVFSAQAYDNGESSGEYEDSYLQHTGQPPTYRRVPVKSKTYTVDEYRALIYEAMGGKPEANRPTTIDMVNMFRLYNRYTGEHLFTTDSVELVELVKVGWIYEGTGWIAPSVGVPVYRLYNPYASDHHYTMDVNEYNELKKVGWKQEGIAFYSTKSTDSGVVPVYRLYNPYATTATHLYTTDANEYAELAKVGWKQEGIAFYGLK